MAVFMGGKRVLFPRNCMGKYLCSGWLVGLSIFMWNGIELDWTANYLKLLSAMLA